MVDPVQIDNIKETEEARSTMRQIAHSDGLRLTLSLLRGAPRHFGGQSLHANPVLYRESVCMDDVEWTTIARV